MQEIAPGPNKVNTKIKTVGLKVKTAKIIPSYSHLRQMPQHHASEGQKTKLVGGDLLEQLLMTTAPTAKRYMSMIMRG